MIDKTINVNLGETRQDYLSEPQQHFTRITLTIPDERDIVMAKNRNYIYISDESNNADLIAAFRVKVLYETTWMNWVEGKEIIMAYRFGKISVPIDNLLRNLFADEDIKTKRNKNVKLEFSVLPIYAQEQTFNLYPNIVEGSYTYNARGFYVLYGSLLAGQHLHNLGTEHKQPLVKDVYVFTKFENKVTIPVLYPTKNCPHRIIKSLNAPTISCLEENLFEDVMVGDAELVDVTIQKNEVETECWYAAIPELRGQQEGVHNGDTTQFTGQFNWSFQRLNNNEVLYRFIPVTLEHGIFVRWIDNIGLWHSYLFDVKDEETTRKDSDESIAKDYLASGVNHEMLSPIDTTFNKKYQCCATRIGRNISDDIKSIIYSQYTEAFINGAFYLVRLDTNSIKIDTRKELCDIEFNLITQETI